MGSALAWQGLKVCGCKGEAPPEVMCASPTTWRSGRSATRRRFHEDAQEAFAVGKETTRLGPSEHRPLHFKTAPSQAKRLDPRVFDEVGLLLTVGQFHVEFRKKELISIVLDYATPPTNSSEYGQAWHKAFHMIVLSTSI